MFDRLHIYDPQKLYRFVRYDLERESQLLD